MPAVGALSEIGVARSAGQHAGVVALLFFRRFVGDGVVDMPFACRPYHDAGNGWPGQGVMNALHGSQGDPERRGFRRKQPPARVALHHRDAHVFSLACGIQLGAGGLHAFEACVVCAEQGIEVARCGHHVESGVRAEHDRFYLARKRRRAGDFGAVRGQAYVFDRARCVQIAYIGDEGAVHNAVEFVDRVDVVDHAQLYMVGAEAGEQVFECRAHLVHIARADILAVLPGRTDVPLDDPSVAFAGDGGAQIAAHLGFGHPAVEDVHARLREPPRHRSHFLGRFALHPFGAESDFADHEFGFAQASIVHAFPLEAMSLCGLPAARRAEPMRARESIPCEAGFAGTVRDSLPRRSRHSGARLPFRHRRRAAARHGRCRARDSAKTHVPPSRGARLSS